MVGDCGSVEVGKSVSADGLGFGVDGAGGGGSFRRTNLVSCGVEGRDGGDDVEVVEGTSSGKSAEVGSHSSFRGVADREVRVGVAGGRGGRGAGGRGVGAGRSDRNRRTPVDVDTGTDEGRSSSVDEGGDEGGVDGARSDRTGRGGDDTEGSGDGQVGV